MMMSPAQYAEQFKNVPYLELLKVKKDLINSISEFEHDYDMDSQDWNVCPGPDVQYQWNLEALGFISSMLAKAFNREYELREEDTLKYGKDMRQFYSE